LYCFFCAALAVPASLHASLMARLDRVGPAKEVAQIEAAAGREFSHAISSPQARKQEGGGDQSSSAGLPTGLNSDFCLRSSPRPANICWTLAGGGFASGLVRRGAIVTGLDTDAAAISAARWRSAPAPMFRTGRAERLPFAGAFRPCRCSERGLLRVEHAEQAIAGMTRVLRPNVIFEPRTSRGVYSPNSPKNSSMRYFNVSYHKNLLRLGAYCSPTPRLHALQVERILGMPRQQVMRGGGRLESKSKGPGAGPGPSEVAYRNLPLSDDGRRGLALADARPAARDAQKSQRCCHC
jgi:SAM-dependent methyltransferase